MAIARAYFGIDMRDTATSYGTVRSATSTDLVISDGYSTITYLGIGLAYSDTTVIAGTLTGFKTSIGGQLAMEAYGLSVPAPTVANYIQSGNFGGLLPIALAGADQFEGSRYDDTIYTYGGDDKITPGLGLNRVDGGAGIDSAIFSRPVSYYKLSADASYKYVNSNDLLEMNTLRSVERLIFSDVTLASDDVAAKGYRLYQAAFDRTPDRVGLSYWVAQLDKGATMQTVASSFVNSAEFAQKFGASTTNQQFIDALYGNVLHRSADGGGYSYWNDQLGKGMSRADVLISFSESAENVNNTAFATNGGVWLNSIDLVF